MLTNIKRDEIVHWLISGDPCVRWQVQRDLIGEPPEIYAKTRKKSEKEGWGNRLLEHQDTVGTWGGGFYSPKWISTHYTLICLSRLGIPQDNLQALKGCQVYLDRMFYEPDGGMNISASYDYSETCVTGMTLNFVAYFNYTDSRVKRLVDYLIKQQMPDGGWNCESYNGATHSSFHTTISVLEGLLSFQVNSPRHSQIITDARLRAHEFLLQHKLFRSHRTGEIVQDRMTRFPFPPRWFYDVLRSLDYFQAAGADHDPRFQDAIDLLIKKQNKGQTWPNYRGPSGLTYFDFEPGAKPGRMNTLRALRVLKWWNTPQIVSNP
jgi:hypothetical protein